MGNGDISFGLYCRQLGWMWCGRVALQGAVLAIVLPSLIYALYSWWRGAAIEMRSGAWWGLYLGVLLLDVELFSSGQPFALGTIPHLLVLAGLSLLVLPIAVGIALPQVSADALTNRLDPCTSTTSAGCAQPPTSAQSSANRCMLNCVIASVPVSGSPLG